MYSTSRQPAAQAIVLGQRTCLNFCPTCKFPSTLNRVSRIVKRAGFWWGRVRRSFSGVGNVFRNPLTPV